MPFEGPGERSFSVCALKGMVVPLTGWLVVPLAPKPPPPVEEPNGDDVLVVALPKPPKEEVAGLLPKRLPPLLAALLVDPNALPPDPNPPPPPPPNELVAVLLLAPNAEPGLEAPKALGAALALLLAFWPKIELLVLLLLEAPNPEPNPVAGLLAPNPPKALPLLLFPNILQSKVGLLFNYKLGPISEKT